MTTIAIIERHPIVRIGLTQFLVQEFVAYPVYECENVAEFIKVYGREKPTLIILGLNGMGLNNGGLSLGLTHLEDLRTRYLSSKVIVYDDVPDPASAFGYLNGGACGYISKSETVESLKEGLAQVLAGRKYVSRETFDAMFNEPISFPDRRTDNADALTQSEFEVANYLVKGLRITHIARILQKQVSTVSTFKKRVFMKLGVKSIIELRTKLSHITSPELR